MELGRLERLCVPAPTASGAPWLLYEHEKKQTFSTIWPKTQSHVREIPEFNDRFIVESSYGWLLFQDNFDPYRFSLWNPMTLETFTLPLIKPYPGDILTSCTILTSSPDDDDDFAVLLFFDDVVCTCFPLSDHNHKWSVDRLEIQDKPASISEAVCCNGVIYAWASTTDSDDSTETSLVTLKVDVEASVSVVLTSLQLDTPNFSNLQYQRDWYWLIESCARVYHVLVTRRHQRFNDVTVWELDLENKRWLEVKSLNDRAFFLATRYSGSSTWCWTVDDGVGVEGNSIYFHSLNLGDGLEKTLYQYRFQDRSLTYHLPCPNPHSVLVTPIWFTPRNHRSLARPSRKPGVDKVCIFDKSVNFADSEYDETRDHMFDYVPQEIVAMISDYLHWFDYLDFRTTCKSIHSVLSPSRCQWRTTYDNSFPLFAYHKTYDGLFEVMDVLRNDSRSINIVIPESKKGTFTKYSSKGGWLILYLGRSDSLLFFNIFTRVRGDFPPCEDALGLMSIGFSTSPTSSDCVTVGMYVSELVVTIYYIRSGDQHWQQAKFDYLEEVFSPSTCSPVYHNGGFYFLDKRGRVGVFELVGEEASWKLHGRPRTRDKVFHSIHLLECEGQLFSVFIGKLGARIQVFRFHDTNKNWVRVKTLGNHVFFVSPFSSVSATASGVGMGNRIYLPNLRDSRFIFYSLETRKCHVVGTEITMDTFCPSQHPFECCWV